MNTFQNATFNLTINEEVHSQVIDLSVNSQADMDKLVKSFQDGFEKQSDEFRRATRKIEVASRGALYHNLATAYAISQVMLDQDNLGYTRTAIAAVGLVPARRGANEYRPIVDLLFGQWVTRKDPKDPAGLKKVDVFVHNRSAEKYAKVLRYLAAKRIKPENAENFISTFSGGMDGILKADTNIHAKDDVDEQAIVRAEKAILNEPSRATLGVNQLSLDVKGGRKLVALWGEVENGKVHIRGQLPTGEGAISSHIRKLAVKVAADLEDETSGKDANSTTSGNDAEAPAPVVELVG